MIVYRCQDSLEGVFTGIYRVYEDRTPRADAMLSLDKEPILFAEERAVEPDPVRAEKVARTLRRRFGEEDYESLCFALATPSEEKAQSVFRTVALGLDGGIKQGHLLDNLAEPHVNKTFLLSRNASRECQHFKGFARFEELESGILYSRIRPVNHLLTFLMPHFADRFPMENFMIFDVGRGLFGVRPAGKTWFLTKGTEPELCHSRQEGQFRQLFQFFCHKIAIEGRRNLDLQRNMLPLRFRENMTEFLDN